MQFELTEKQQKIVQTLYEKHKDDNQPSEVHDHRSYTNGLGAGECKILEKEFAHVLDGPVDRAMILIEFKPWGIHVDENARLGCLIPIETQPTHTIVFGINEPVTDEYHNEYLSHVSRMQTQNLWVDETYAWRKGTGIVWNADSLHTSDNFTARGLDKKIALVIFTKR